MHPPADTILVPTMHFHSKKYDKNWIKMIPKFQEEREWSKKEPKLYGRFRCGQVLVGQAAHKAVATE